MKIRRKRSLSVARSPECCGIKDVDIRREAFVQAQCYMQEMFNDRYQNPMMIFCNITPLMINALGDVYNNGPADFLGDHGIRRDYLWDIINDYRTR